MFEVRDYAWLALAGERERQHLFLDWDNADADADVYLFNSPETFASPVVLPVAVIPEPSTRALFPLGFMMRQRKEA